MESKSTSNESECPYVEIDTKAIKTELDSVKEAYYRTFEVMPEAALISAKGKIIAANTLASVMFHYSPTELVGMMIEELIPKEQRAIHEKLRAKFEIQACCRPMGIGLPLNCMTREGDVFQVEIMLSPFSVTGLGLCILSVLKRVKS